MATQRVDVHQSNQTGDQQAMTNFEIVLAGAGFILCVMWDTLVETIGR